VTAVPGPRARLACAVLRADARGRVALRDLYREVREGGLPVQPVAPAGARGRVLLTDMQVPRTDRNAGDRNIFDFMRTLMEGGWSVSYYPRDISDDPFYSDPLRAIGVEVVAGPARPPLVRWLRARRHELRHVIVCRPTVAAAYLPSIRRHAAELPVTYYGHDLHFARLRMEAEVLGRERSGRVAAKMEALERWCWRHSDAVIYPTFDEACEVATLSPGTLVRAVPIFRFDRFATRKAMPDAKQVLFVGGFGHPPNIDAATWLAREIWPKVRSAEPDARLQIIGANPPDAVRALASDDITVPGPVSHAELAGLYAGSRVAAVPLRIGAGMKLKVVESLALGVPLVTTSVGAQGLEGLDTVDRADSFAAETVRLLRLNETAWLEQSRRQVTYAAGRFDGAAMGNALEGALAAAAKSHRERSE
jgi:glycosyltransferase involved in cell wall biosynthesis